jgi:hypothetical protein|tara:strand:+ start:9002 stop:9583 length:582 start_codon:yes stop_codon:yes gene_type:complete
MGTTAKKVLGYGGLAAGTYFTGGALLGAKSAMGAGATLSGAFANKGVQTALLMGLGSANVGSQFLGAAASDEALAMEAEQIKLQMKQDELRGREDALNIADEKRRLRNIVLAQAAGQGKTINSNRAMLKELDRRAKDDRTALRTNTLSDLYSSKLRLRDIGTRTIGNTTTALLGSTRSLLTTAMDYGRAKGPS